MCVWKDHCISARIRPTAWRLQFIMSLICSLWIIPLKSFTRNCRIDRRHPRTDGSGSRGYVQGGESRFNRPFLLRGSTHRLTCLPLLSTLFSDRTEPRSLLFSSREETRRLPKRTLPLRLTTTRAPLPSRPRNLPSFTPTEPRVCYLNSNISYFRVNPWTVTSRLNDKGSPIISFPPLRLSAYNSLTPPQHDKVIADCDSALRLDPVYIKALRRRAAALEALDRDEEAVRGSSSFFCSYAWSFRRLPRSHLPHRTKLEE